MALIDAAPPLLLWRSYEYFPAGHNYFKPRYDASGGPEGRPCLWADDAMWTVDTPENPNSILFLLHYRFWDNQPPLDLRGAELRFRLRGDNLDLHGARCHFWAVTHLGATTRWHFVRQDIPIVPGAWGEETVVRLEADPAQWHCSFVSKPETNLPTSLESTLAVCFSYGFSFVGFSKKVTGRIGLADFRLRLEADSDWPFVFGSRSGGEDLWLTVSGTRKKQEAISDPTRISAGQSLLAGEGEAGFSVADDYLPLVGDSLSYAYLALARSFQTTGGRDLRNALLMVRHSAERFDAQGGQICFFVEHAASGTRWVLNVIGDVSVKSLRWVTLAPEEPSWIRLSGSLPLAEVLAGSSGLAGYDYFGLMVVGFTGVPSGTWGLTQFSLGPIMDRRSAPLPEETP